MKGVKKESLSFGKDNLQAASRRGTPRLPSPMPQIVEKEKAFRRGSSASGSVSEGGGSTLSGRMITGRKKTEEGVCEVRPSLGAGGDPRLAFPKRTP